ncbi:MAG: ASPIC/UnbV domain-containing protein, partial [Acidobacteria bacterium]|nr:ASPIC/UnbV domain-containing protein [Acidobacteriota bacterium]
SGQVEALRLAEVSRGAAFGDIDSDGDIDIVVSNNNGPARLLLNESGSKHHWLKVRLESPTGNREGIGARVALLRRSGSPLWRRVHRDGSYLSSSDPTIHFGLANDTEIKGIGVVWPSGDREVWEHTRPDSLVTLKYGTGKLWK